MFIHDPNKTVFQAMNDWDGSSDPEQRVKDLRNAVNTYNADNGTFHVFDGVLINLYWAWLDAQGLLLKSPQY